jgi:hypothetical protein
MKIKKGNRRKGHIRENIDVSDLEIFANMKKKNTGNKNMIIGMMNIIFF